MMAWCRRLTLGGLVVLLVMVMTPPSLATSGVHAAPPPKPLADHVTAGPSLAPGCHFADADDPTRGQVCTLVNASPPRWQSSVCVNGMCTPPPATPTEQAFCRAALTYLREHANPQYRMVCAPGSLPSTWAAATCTYAVPVGSRAPGAGVCGKDGPEILLSDPSCPVSYEDEASNSWFHFPTGGPPVTVRPGTRDATGRVWDPYGACP